MNSGYSPPVVAQHLAQPLPRDLAAGLGDRVHDAVGVALAAHRLVHLDQAEPHQPLERLVEARPRAHVDDPVLALLLEQLLHPVDVHGLRDELPQHDQAERRSACRAPWADVRRRSWSGTY